MPLSKLAWGMAGIICAVGSVGAIVAGVGMVCGGICVGNVLMGVLTAGIIGETATVLAGATLGGKGLLAGNNKSPKKCTATMPSMLAMVFWIICFCSWVIAPIT